MNRRYVIALPVCLAALPAVAAEPPEPPVSALDEAIEVVAFRWDAPAWTATPAISSFGAADIERRQAQTVADLLSEVPGVQILTDGPRGQNSRVFLRGTASNQTLVLVDGVPQNDATTGGGFDFGDLGTTDVERIDVLRGSYGVLYGSEAIGGVVAVTTQRGLMARNRADPRASRGSHGEASQRGAGTWRGFVSAEGGSFATHREAFGAGGGDDAFDLWASAWHEATGGERRREDFVATGGAVRLGARLASSLRADFSLRAVEAEFESPLDYPGFGSTVIPEDANIDRTRDTLSSSLALTHEAGESLTTRLTLSYFRAESSYVNGSDGPELVDPDFTPGTGDEFVAVRDELVAANRTRDVRVRLASTWHAGRALGWRRPSEGGLDLDLTAGGEVLDQASRSAATFPNFGAAGSSTSVTGRSLDTDSLFVLGELRLPDLGPARGGVVALGVRRDDHETFGGESSPYAGVRWDVAPTDTTLRASWGEGFRAPKPSELDDASVGNADLGPETSESMDAGVSQRFLGGDVEAGVTVFRIETDDLIAFDPAATSPSRPFGQLTNFSRTRTTGAEWEVRADVGGGFEVRGAYTRQNPRDVDTGDPLPNRSREFVGAGVSWERGAFLVSLDGLWTTKFPAQGGEYTYPEPDERRAPGRRALVNLTARWRASENVTWFARIENLLDDDWVATPTAPAGNPLGVFAGVRIDF